MKHPVSGGLLLFSLIVLTGCASPLSQREAQGFGALALRGYCAGATPCHVYRLVRAQHLGDGWMLDYESDITKYGVMVHRNGVTQVTAWAKDADSTAR